ncbi:MAG: hypothetical protein Q9220_002577, partial [cf. Caloplaca sp. 1 TL-2023]
LDFLFHLSLHNAVPYLSLPFPRSMFDDYTFATASQPHGVYTTNYMDDGVSPTSSRMTTPPPDEMYTSDTRSDSNMITELSVRLEQYNLGASTQPLGTFSEAALPATFSDIEPPTLPLRKLRPQASSLNVWQQRQILTRRRCHPAHLSHIKTLAESIEQDTTPCYNVAHPSSNHQGPLSPTSDPSSLNSPESTPSSSGSEDCSFESHHISKYALANRIGKEWRRETSLDAVERRQKLVMKKIRMRKSLARMKVAA